MFYHPFIKPNRLTKALDFCEDKKHKNTYKSYFEEYNENIVMFSDNKIKDITSLPLLLIFKRMKLFLYIIPLVVTKYTSYTLHTALLSHLFTNNGYLLTKIGQWLSTYSSLKLKHLQNKLKEHTFKETEEILKEIEKDFEIKYNFYKKYKRNTITPYKLIITSKVPLFSGSIAQIYCWKLQDKISKKENKVVVKILHPHIQREIQSDIILLKYFSSFFNKFHIIKSLNLPQFINNISVEVNSQLNLKNEYKNLKLFKKQNQIEILEDIKYILLNFSYNKLVDKNSLNKIYRSLNFNSLENKNLTKVNNNNIKDSKIIKIITHVIETINNIRVPKPIYASKNILIEEYIPGNNSKNKIISDRNIILMYNGIFRMISNRFIHIDLHPGNILFSTKNKYSNTSNPALFDYGLFKVLNSEKYTNLKDLIKIIITREPIVGNVLIERLEENNTNDTNINKKEFNREINIFMNKFYSRIDAGNDRKYLLGVKDIVEFLNLLKKYNVKLDCIYNSIISSILCLNEHITDINYNNRSYSTGYPGVKITKKARREYNTLSTSIYKEAPIFYILKEFRKKNRIFKYF